MSNRIAKCIGAALGLALIGAPAVARQGGIVIIRDAETEHTIREFAAPVLLAAGLDTQIVRFHIVHDSAVNAFVAGGQRIFLTTALLQRAESPNQLIGVIAHETGHIAAGHLARIPDALRQASAQALLSFLLGAAAAVGGSPEAGAAIISGGQHVAQRSYLQFSRTQESAADQAALTFLDRAGQSARGLLEFLKSLGDQEVLLVETRDPYARTHPIGGERVAALRARAEQSQYYDAEEPRGQRDLLIRLHAKLIGYIEPQGTTLRHYPPSDTSLPARYARAHAYMRSAEAAKALGEIDALLAERADDPFFHELKGQILFESGRIAEAIPSQQAAVRLAPGEPLLRVALAQSLIATEKPESNREAIGHLVEAARLESHFSLLWQQLAVAYGREGNLAMSALANAERFVLEGNRRDARGQAERVQRMVPNGSPAWLRAQDIIDASSRENRQ